MNNQYIAPSLNEIINVLAWVVHHKMCVKRQIRSFSPVSDQRGAVSKIWNKMTIHDIQMHGFGAIRLKPSKHFRHPCEVAGQQAGGKYG